MPSLLAWALPRHDGADAYKHQDTNNTADRCADQCRTICAHVFVTAVSKSPGRRLRVSGCDAAVRGIGVAATVAESARHLGGGERVPTLRVARRQGGARVGASVPPLVPEHALRRASVWIRASGGEGTRNERCERRESWRASVARALVRAFNARTRALALVRLCGTCRFPQKFIEIRICTHAANQKNFWSNVRLGQSPADLKLVRDGVA